MGNNFWDQFEKAAKEQDTYVKDVLLKLDERGIPYKIVHDEIIVEAPAEVIQEIFGRDPK